MRDYATRSNRLTVRSIEIGVVLLARLSMNRKRGFMASVRRAHRNTSMKKTAAPQTLANANNPITPRLRARRGPRSLERSSHRTHEKQRCARLPYRGVKSCCPQLSTIVEPHDTLRG